MRGQKEVKGIAADIGRSAWTELRPRIIKTGSAIVERVGLKLLVPLVMLSGGLTVAETTTDFQPVSNLSSNVVAAASDSAESDDRRLTALEAQVASSTAATLELTQAFTLFVQEITPRINRADPFGDPRSLGTDCSGQSLEFIHFINVDVIGSAGVDVLGSTSSRITVAGDLTFDTLAAPGFVASEGTAGTLTITDTLTDGYAITAAPGTSTSPTLGGSTRPGLTFGSLTERTTADHLYVTATVSDCTVGEVTFTDIRVSGGSVTATYFDLGGDLNMVDSSIGDGDGPSVVDLDIAASVIVGGVQTVSGVDHFAGTDVN